MLGKALILLSLVGAAVYFKYGSQVQDMELVQNLKDKIYTISQTQQVQDLENVIEQTLDYENNMLGTYKVQRLSSTPNFLAETDGQSTTSGANDHYNCFYQKYCAYDHKYDMDTKIQSSDHLKSYLKSTLKDKAHYHFTMNLDNGQIDRDMTVKHNYQCKNEYSNQMRIYCEYNLLAQNSAKLGFQVLALIILMFLW